MSKTRSEYVREHERAIGDANEANDRADDAAEIMAELDGDFRTELNGAFEQFVIFAGAGNFEDLHAAMLAYQDWTVN